MSDLQERQNGLERDMKAKGYVPFPINYYGNVGEAVAVAFHRAEFVPMQAVEVDKVMNRHNAYCLGYGDKIFVVFK